MYEKIYREMYDVTDYVTVNYVESDTLEEGGYRVFAKYPIKKGQVSSSDPVVCCFSHRYTVVLWLTVCLC